MIIRSKKANFSHLMKNDKRIVMSNILQKKSYHKIRERKRIPIALNMAKFVVKLSAGVQLILAKSKNYPTLENNRKVNLKMNTFLQ